MKEVNALLCSNENFKIVEVIFSTSKTPSGKSKPYTFKTLLDLKPDDQVVVKVTNGVEQEILKCATVSRLVPLHEVNLDSDDEIRWVVSIIDTLVYDDCMAAERKMANQLMNAKAQRLRKESLELLESTVGSTVFDSLKSLVRKL